LDDAPTWVRCGALAFLVTSPSFAQAFFGLVLPERDLILFLIVWIACVRSFDRTGNRWAFCGALVAAQFVLYYKETAFVLVAGVAGVRLALAAWRARLVGITPARFARDRALELAHVALCAVFLATYVVAVGRHTKEWYVDPSGASPAITALAAYVRADLVIDLLAIAFAARVVLAAANRVRLDVLWDSLAAGALAFAAAYVKLGMVREYYLSPADVIGVLYLSRLAWMGRRAMHRAVVVAISFALSFLFWQNARDDAFAILAREELVDANVALASFLGARAAERPSSMTLFFPQTGGFQLMELSAFLRFKGLRLDDGNAANDAPILVVTSPHRFPGDLCHVSQEFRCRFAATPGAQDLIVFPPGRPTRAGIAALANAHELFHYRPSPTATQRFLRALAPSDQLLERPPAEAVVLGLGPDKS
jgi:hypothetical protein